jgi:hypothetical protein
MGWIGVDLDGTLAHYDHWRGAMHIGAPIELMVKQVKKWIDEGLGVKIVTARVSQDGSCGRQHDAAQSVLAIQEWCLNHLGAYLPITCEKDFGMIELWDDRAVAVRQNTGLQLSPSLYGEYVGLDKSKGVL